MELEINKKKVHTITGFLSFLCGLISLAGLNAALLLKGGDYPEVLLFQLPFIGLFLGIIGLFTRKHSRMYAWWGIGINSFILIFTAMMFILAWSINAKP
ncbi:hypothetical protein FZW96_19660 [Bacillus sp. BGMRC 2118]|nr:hypothetical protein FZW96_19660 [Bacillus sp. BGMRC 2118]